MTGATVGKLVAAVVFLGVAGLIGLSIVRSGSERDQAPDAGVEAMEAPSGDVTVVDLPTTDAAMSSLLGVGEAPVWRQVDADGSLKAEILADSLEPEKAGRIRLVRPRATFPTPDGRVEVTAAEGSIIRRSGGEPESGDLSGGVTINLLRDDATAPDGARVIGTFQTSTLHFEESRREVSTTDDITIDAEGARFRGRGLTVRLDEGDKSNAMRLLFLRIESGGHLEVEPDTLAEVTKEPKDPKDPQDPKDPKDPSAASPTTGAPAPTPKPIATVESFYRVIASQDVDLKWGTTRVRGDRVEGSARLVNGKLAPDAIRPFPSEDDAPPSSGSTDATDPGLPTPAEKTQTATLTWAGPLELQLVDTRPADLAPEFGDEASVKWIGVGKGSVRAEDATQGVFAESAEVRYGLTSGRLRMMGKPGVRGVDLGGEGKGELHSDHAEIDLSALPEIVAWVEGPGTVVPVVAEDEAAPEVAWNERADLTAIQQSTEDVRITSVSASGDVRAAARGWVLESAFARAIMNPHAPQAELDRVLLRDGFKAVSEARKESIEGNDAEIRFDRPTEVGEMAGEPRSAFVTGGVRLAQKSMRVEADAVTADLITDADGNPEIASAEATGSVRAILAQGVEVRAPQARVDRVAGETVSVSGAGSSVTVTKGSKTLQVLSESMEVRRSEGTVVAYGPGTAEQRVASTSDKPAETATLSWTDGLTYDDTTGIAELMGDVKGLRTIELSQAQRFAAPGGATVSITPGVLVEDTQPDPDVLAVVLDGFADTQAEIEARRYVPHPTGAERGPLEGVVALRSGQIALDVDRKRVTTPGAGVLVVEDRRPAETPDNPTGGVGAMSELGVDPRGTTAFRWNNSMVFDWLSGRAEMTGGVRVSHIDATSQNITELHADRLNADLLPAPTDGTMPSIEHATDILHRISAWDHVRVEHKNYTLECDVLDFDKVANLFTLQAREGARIRALDRVSGTTTQAQKVTIDPRTGDMSFDGLSGITSGR